MKINLYRRVDDQPPVTITCYFSPVREMFPDGSVGWDVTFSGAELYGEPVKLARDEMALVTEGAEIQLEEDIRYHREIAAFIAAQTP